jgi:flagellin
VDVTRIASNIGALNALNSLNTINSQLAIHQTRLATGMRINSAADDPAGLTISTKFQARSDGLGQALANISDAQNMLAVAEGGLCKIKDILIQMKDKSVQAASDTLGAAERSAIQKQLTDWTSEIDNIVSNTTWNGNKLLDGLQSFGASQTINFQAGVDTSAADVISLSSTSFGSVSSASLGLTSCVTGSASVTLTSGSAVAGVTTSTVATGYTELASGSYNIQVSWLGGTFGVFSILEHDSNPFTQDDNPATFCRTDGSSGTSESCDCSSSHVFNTGIGITISMNALAEDGNSSNYITYTQAPSSGGINVNSASGARLAMNSIDSALATVSTRLQTLGSLNARMTVRSETLCIAKTNIEAATSRIVNSDMAEEQLNFAKGQVLQQTAMSMLTQANQAPQLMLALFRP